MYSVLQLFGVGSYTRQVFFQERCMNIFIYPKVRIVYGKQIYYLFGSIVNKYIIAVIDLTTIDKYNKLNTFNLVININKKYLSKKRHG